MQVTAKLHGPFPGLHQVITLADSAAFLWYLRHVRVLDGTLHTLPQRAMLLLEERPRTQFMRTVHLRVDPETDMGANRRNLGPQLIHVKRVKCHATMQHVCEGTTSLWQLQTKELADEQA